MGASNSSPRSYSVEPDDPKTDASMDIVAVSDDVIKRLMGYEYEREAAPPPPTSTPVITPKAQVLPPPVCSPSRERALEGQLRKLHDTIERSEEDFLRTYDSIRHQVESDKAVPFRTDACTNLADTVVTCYRENSDNPLKCRSHVVAFRECVLTSLASAKPAK
uniref:Head-elevated expression protein n=1 Tax=Phlebotomus kandelakii TaxID=1109342 RepID=A0A6B2ENN6_9DIPT